MTHWKKLLSAFGLGVFVAVVLLAFSAYLNPAMLIGLANLRLCS
jgi:glycerol uptake facilitator-like aquaporin